MKAEFCRFEEAVTAAIQSGEWNEDLRRHVAGCEECADLALVARYCAAAAKDIPEAPLPAAGLLWWRAQIAERQEQAERAVAAIEVVQKVAIGVVLVLLLGLLMLSKPVHWEALLAAFGLFASSGVVLYSWVRGRI